MNLLRIVGLMMVLSAITFTVGLFYTIEPYIVHPEPSETGLEASHDVYWVYDGEIYHVAYHVYTGAYTAYAQCGAVRNMSKFSYEAYIIVDDTVQRVAHALDSLTVNMTDTDRINMVAAFVHSCVFYRPDSGPISEYYQYPTETLFLRSGDCEDCALLTAALLRAMGYDSHVATWIGHAVTAVRSEGGLTAFNGLSYQLIDSANGGRLGQYDGPMIVITTEATVLKIIVILILLSLSQYICWQVRTKGIYTQ